MENKRTMQEGLNFWLFFEGEKLIFKISRKNSKRKILNFLK